MVAVPMADAESARRYPDPPSAGPGIPLLAVKPWPERYHVIGRLDTSPVLAAGVLTVDTYTVTRVDKGDMSGMILINLDAPTEAGERSHVWNMKVHCKTSALSFDWWGAYSQVNGAGVRLRSEELNPPLVVTNPEGALALMHRALCEQS